MQSSRYKKNDRVLAKKILQVKSDMSGFTLKLKTKIFLTHQHIPKVVFRKDGNLIYMSRAPIPSNKKKKFLKAWRQVCIYSFPYQSLKIFSNVKKKTVLEKIEDLELNRFIEIGYQVKMIKMSNKSVAVDTKNDLKKVIKMIR